MIDRLKELLKDTLSEWECDVTDDTIQEIANHLLANGVIVPPCKVGQTVYYVCLASSEVCKGRVVGISVNPFTTPQMWFSIEYDSKLIGRQVTEGNHMFGTFVFFTREEAEKALAEREGKG